jgi:hypothetical protein
MPARTAPSTFSLTPPIGSTRPRSVISPVIATSCAPAGPTSRSRPAPSPSRRPPTARPSGSRPPARGRGPRSSRGGPRDPSDRVRRRVRQRGARRLLHHVAELAGEDERHVALAAHLHLLVVSRACAPCSADRRLDEHDVAAHRRVVHAGRDADLVLLARARDAPRPPSSSRTSSRDRSSVVRSISPDAILRATLRATAPICALELAHAALARVVRRRLITASSVNVDFLSLEPRLLELARDEVLLRDLRLLALGVAGELDDLHAVEQRTRNVLDEVRRRDEQHLAQVERHAEVVIGERVVLRRIEHLEQRARRIALERRRACRPRRAGRPGSSSRLLHALDDAARHGADVGAAVAADVGLVARAAERDAHVLASERAAIDLAIDVLPTPGGPTNSRIGPFAIARAFASFVLVGDRLRRPRRAARRGRASSFSALSFAAGTSPVFSTSSPAAARAAGAPRGTRARGPSRRAGRSGPRRAPSARASGRAVVRALVPRQLGDPLEVGADDLRFHRLAAGALEASELALDFLARLLRQLELVELLAQLGDLLD